MHLHQHTIPNGVWTRHDNNCTHHAPTHDSKRRLDASRQQLHTRDVGGDRRHRMSSYAAHDAAHATACTWKRTSKIGRPTWQAACTSLPACQATAARNQKINHSLTTKNCGTSKPSWLSAIHPFSPEAKCSWPGSRAGSLSRTSPKDHC